MDDCFCSCCKSGKIRALQFSLDEAVIICDNVNCDSYLDAWPWECTISRNILKNSNISRYERESECSSDSSGVQSDFGGSGISQTSVTDQEVEQLLSKKYSKRLLSFQKHLNLIASPPKCFSQWNTPSKTADGEPFMSLESVYNGKLSNDSNSESGSLSLCNDGYFNEELQKGDDFLEMLKNVPSYKETSKAPCFASNLGISDEDTVDELESWIQGIEKHVLEKKTANESGSVQKGNTDGNISSLKSLIPSSTSAFYGVPCKTSDYSSSTSISLKMSPKGDDFIPFTTNTELNEDDESESNTDSFTNNLFPKALPVLELKTHEKEMKMAEELSKNIFNNFEMHEEDTKGCNQKFIHSTSSLQEQSLQENIFKTLDISNNKDSDKDMLLNLNKKSLSTATTICNVDISLCKNEPASLVQSPDPADQEMQFEELLNSVPIPSSSSVYKASYAPALHPSPLDNREDVVLTNNEVNSDDTILEAINMLKSLQDCSNSMDVESTDKIANDDFVKKDTKFIKKEQMQNSPKADDQEKAENNLCNKSTNNELIELQSAQELSVQVKENNTEILDSLLEVLQTKQESNILQNCFAEVDAQKSNENELKDKVNQIDEAKSALSIPVVEEEICFITNEAEEKQEIQEQQVEFSSVTFAPIHSPLKPSQRRKPGSGSSTSSKPKYVYVDPWSVPELSIDELNIEVFLQSSSDSKDSTDDKAVSDISSPHVVTKISSVTKNENVLYEKDTSALTQTPASEVIDTSVRPKTTVLPSPSSLPKMDIYEPVYLQAKVLDATECGGVTPVRLGCSRQMRHSVGYAEEDAKGAEEVLDKAILDSSINSYFNDVIDNVDFDEQFCKIDFSSPEKSKENTHGGFDNDSAKTCQTALENAQVKELNAFTIRRIKRERSSSATNLFSDTSPMFSDMQCDTSDNDMFSNSNSDDELEVYFPIKTYARKSFKSRYERNELRGQKRRPEEYFLSPSKKFKVERTSNISPNKHFCGILDSSIPHGQSCCQSDDEGADLRSNNKDITIDSPLISQNHSNVILDDFLIINNCYNFGYLKGEPEILNSLLPDEDNCSEFEGDYLSLTDESLWNNASMPCKSKVKQKSHMKRSLKIKKNGSFKHLVTPLSRPPKNRKITKYDENKCNLQTKTGFKNLPSNANYLEDVNKPSSSIQEAMKLLHDSGWIVTPSCGAIDYDSPSTSPTVIPSSLTETYGHAGSDVVVWKRTEEGVEQQVQQSFCMGVSNSNSINRLNNTKERERYVNSAIKKPASGISKYFGSLNYRKVRSQKFVEARSGTKSGSLASMRQRFVDSKSPVMVPPEEENIEDQMFIELPDDQSAYEEACREGHQVGVPQPLPDQIFIPPKPKASLKPRVTRPPSFSPSVSPSPSPPPPTMDDVRQMRAEEELKKIVSERPAKDIPQVVCVNIDGKVYMYHKDGGKSY